jgi:hypothetical protein
MKNTKALFKLKNSTSLVMLLVTLLTITINLSSCSSKDSEPAITTGVVQGYVKDGSNNIAGVTVTLKQAGQKDRVMITLKDGLFLFTDVPVGAFSIVCTAPLFKDLNVAGVVAAARGVTSVTTVMEGDTSIKTLIPDPKFEEALIKKGLDTAPVDGSVPTYKISRVTDLFISLSGIADLTGIQDFKALENLDCSNNATATAKLTNLDVSKNTALKTLNCNYNNITTLDLSKNVALTNLRCYFNLLTTLDLSNNVVLTDLGVGKNLQLTTLNVSKNTTLKNLDYSDCSLNTVDLSQNTALEQLYCYNNKLTTLDVSKNGALRTLWCYNNQIATLDVSKSTGLRSFYCQTNRLTALDLQNNSVLTELFCDFNQLATLDVHNNIALTLIRCSNNKLTTLDVSKNTALGGTNGGLFCSDNLLTTLNFKNGNNTNIIVSGPNPGIYFKNNASGFVIAVDDVAYSKTNWGSYKDAGAIYVSSF